MRGREEHTAGILKPSDISVLLMLWNAFYYIPSNHHADKGGDILSLLNKGSKDEERLVWF